MLTAVLLLMLFKREPGRVTDVSSLIQESPDAIIFLLGSFAAVEIHLVDGGSVALGSRVIENAQSLFFFARR